jgi:L-fucose isomerase-like protein
MTQIDVMTRADGAERYAFERDPSAALEPLRAGYVALGSDLYDPPILQGISARAEQQLTDAGIELVRTDPVYELGQERRAIDDLRKGDWDFLIVNVINWIEYRAATRIIQEFRDKPMVLYAFGGYTEGDTLISPAAGAGSTALRYPMEQWGIRFRYLFNPPDSPMDVEGVVRLGRAAQVARRLRYARLGLIGFNDVGLYTTAYNVTKLRRQLGPEVESVDLLELERRIPDLDDAVVQKVVETITADWEYPNGRPDDEVIERTIRLYMATLDVCRDKGFDALTYKSVEGVLMGLHIVHNVPASLLVSAGIPYTDENDLGNLLAELMLKWLSGRTATFLEHYELHPEWIIMGVDGYVPHQLIEGNPVMKTPALLGATGVGHGSRMKAGRMTMAALAEDDQGYRMHIAPGLAESPPKWMELGTGLPSWPSVKFFPDAPVRDILDHVQSQHFAAVHGDYTDELVDLCHLLGIRTVVDR